LAAIKNILNTCKNSTLNFVSYHKFTN
jgi:hypothetical protein